jgi:hypothetical protein
MDILIWGKKKKKRGVYDDNYDLSWHLQLSWFRQKVLTNSMHPQMAR